MNENSVKNSVITATVLVFCHVLLTMGGEVDEVRARLRVMNQSGRLQSLPRVKKLSDDETKLLIDAVKLWSRGMPAIEENRVFGIAVDFAGEVGIPAVLQELKSVALDEKQRSIRRGQAISALMFSKDPTLVTTFEKAVKDPSVQSTAMCALAYLGTPRAVKVLKEIGKNDPSEFWSTGQTARDYADICSWLIVARDQTIPWEKREEAIARLAQSIWPVGNGSVEDIRQGEEDPEHVRRIEVIEKEAAPIRLKKLQSRPPHTNAKQSDVQQRRPVPEN